MCEADISIYRLPPSWKSLSFVLVWIAIEFLASTDVFRERCCPFNSSLVCTTSHLTRAKGRSWAPVAWGKGSEFEAPSEALGLFFRSRLAQWLKVWELGVSGSPAKALEGLRVPLGVRWPPVVGLKAVHRAVPHSPGSASLGGFSLKLYFYSCWCF